MLKNAIRITLVVLLLAMPAMAFGQDMPSGKWWRIPRVAKKLNLNDKEVQQLEDAYRDSRRKFIQLKSQVEKEQFELENLIDSKSLDDAAIQKQYERLETARTKLGEERFRFLIKIRKIVGYDRFQELVSAKKNHQTKRMRRDSDRLTPKE